MGREDRDWVDIADVFLKALSGILIPVAIFVVGYLVSEQQRSAELARQNADQIARLFDHLASENSRRRILAIQLMKHLAEDTEAKYPQELIVALINTVETDEDPEVALAASSALGATTQSRAELKDLVKQSLARIPPRVYIHIRSEDQRAPASRVASILEGEGYVVPGVERLVDVGPKVTQLRFVRRAEEEEAREIKEFLRQNDVVAELRDLSSRYENSEAIRPRHYELWFAPDHFR